MPPFLVRSALTTFLEPARHPIALESAVSDIPSSCFYLFFILRFYFSGQLSSTDGPENAVIYYTYSLSYILRTVPFYL